MTKELPIRLCDLTLNKLIGRGASNLLDKLIYLSKGTHNSFTASQSYLAELTTYCTRQVRTHTKKLVELGLITNTVQNYKNDKNQLRSRNHYTINADAINALCPNFISRKKHLPNPSSSKKYFKKNTLLKESVSSKRDRQKKEFKIQILKEEKRVNDVLAFLKEHQLDHLNDRVLEQHREFVERRVVEGEVLEDTGSPEYRAPETKNKPLRGMRLPDDTVMTPRWREVLIRANIHEDHHEDIFEEFCQYWWEEATDKKALKSNWYRTWMNWVSMKRNRSHHLSKGHSPEEKKRVAEYNRTVFVEGDIHEGYACSPGMARLFIEKRERLKQNPYVSFQSTLPHDIQRDSFIRNKTEPLSIIHRNIIDILARTKGKDTAEACWSSWFKGNEITESEGGYVMNVKSRFRKDYITTHFRDVCDELNIEIEC